MLIALLVNKWGEKAKTYVLAPRRRIKLLGQLLNVASYAGNPIRFDGLCAIGRFRSDSGNSDYHLDVFR